MQKIPKLCTCFACALTTLFGLTLFASAEGLSSTTANTDYFQLLLGVSEAEVATKTNEAWQHFFEGDSQTERLFYEVEAEMAYIADIGNQDVRSEGMSYGMMIAVMLDRKPAFDKLWKWAKTYMYHSSGGREGYFAWHCDFDGNQLSDASASDGEEWFAMALYFAAGRWGNGEGIFNYQKQADQLLHDMLHKEGADGYLKSIFHKKELQPVFVPHGIYAEFTDPSYHLPAFYTLWEKWAAEDNEIWAKCAEISRNFFPRAAHTANWPDAGLRPLRRLRTNGG